MTKKIEPTLIERLRVVAEFDGAIKWKPSINSSNGSIRPYISTPFETEKACQHFIDNHYAKMTANIVPHFYTPEYHTDWNELHRVWILFRDMKFDHLSDNELKHRDHKYLIGFELNNGTPESAFNAVYEAIVWFNGLSPAASKN